jgi:hypothetical protein
VKVEKQNIASEHVQCPFRVSYLEVKQVGDMHILLHDLLKLALVKMSRLKVEKTRLFEMFIGFQFNMEDGKTAIIKVQESIAKIVHHISKP